MCDIKHPINSVIPAEQFAGPGKNGKKRLIRPNRIDLDIYAYYTSIDENTCAATLKCGCKCPSVCGTNGYCAEHFYTPNFAAATKHSHFTDTTQKLVIKKQNTDYSRVYACFGTIPLEILLNIVRYIRFPDLKVLYTMRIPGILALVQGDMLFNHEALYASSVLSSNVVRKFQSEYTRGLRAIDRAILMTRVCSKQNENVLSIERNRTNDMRNYQFDAITKRASSDVGYREYIQNLKMKPAAGYSARVFHTIGFRRCLPGVLDLPAEFQYVREFVYDDYYARKPAETAYIKWYYKANRHAFSMEYGPWA